MKRIFSLIIVGWIVLLPCWSSAYDLSKEAQETDRELLQEILKKLDTPEEKTDCPIPESAYSTIDCFKCHTDPAFEIKYPNHEMKKKVIDGEEVMYFYLVEIPDNELRDCFEYMIKNGMKKLIIEIQSPGGTIFYAYRNVSLIEYYKSRGIEVETRLHGSAMSAGFLIFMAGDTRLMSNRAMIMWHEVQSISFYFGMGFNITTPSDKEEEARILRFLNDNPQNYIANRCNLTKEELDQLVKKCELWVGFDKALEYGFATGLLE